MHNDKLANLIKACEYMRDSAGYNQKTHEHVISSSVWSAFCAQIKHAKHKDFQNGSNER